MQLLFTLCSLSFIITFTPTLEKYFASATCCIPSLVRQLRHVYLNPLNTFLTLLYSKLFFYFLKFSRIIWIYKHTNMLCRDMYASVYVCMYVCICVYIYTCVCLYMFVCMYLSICVCVSTCVCIYICKYIFACIYVWTYSCMYLYMWINRCIYLYM